MAKKHRFLEQLGGDPFVDDDTDVTTETGNEFAEMIAHEAARGFAKLKQGDKVDAKVVGIVDGSIVFDVGQRSEGIYVWVKDTGGSRYTRRRGRNDDRRGRNDDRRGRN